MITDVLDLRFSWLCMSYKIEIWICLWWGKRNFLQLYNCLFFLPNSGQHCRWAAIPTIIRKKSKIVSNIFTTNLLRIYITIFSENIAQNGKKKKGKVVEAVKDNETMNKINSIKNFSSLILQWLEKGRSPMIFHVLLHIIHTHYKIILSLRKKKVILNLWKGS